MASSSSRPRWSWKAGPAQESSREVQVKKMPKPLPELAKETPEKKRRRQKPDEETELPEKKTRRHKPDEETELPEKKRRRDSSRTTMIGLIYTECHPKPQEAAQSQANAEEEPGCRGGIHVIIKRPMS